MKRVFYFIFIIIIFILLAKLFYSYFSMRLDKEILRVEVLNGTDVNGLATKMSKYLKNKKLDVLIISNADYDTISQTIVIDRIKKNSAYAKYVAKQIHCENIMSDIDSSLYIDVTVIVGNDYEKYIKEKNNE